MTAEIGRFALILAFALAVAQSLLPLVGAHRRDQRLMAFGDMAALLQFILTAISFACLTKAFTESDFSLSVVAANSHTDKPLLYKIAGVWGNHEGSMLLWALILSLFGGAIGVAGQSIPDKLRARALAVQGMIGAGFLAFLLFTSDPFARLFPVPLQGQGLNPLLQDPGLAAHPPFLYLGYVGFSTAFSFAVAALIEGRADSSWAHHARPWVLLAWTFLTIGIALGSIWAYYELGWGGYWAWDPVENVSLMPWLLGTALLHSLFVVERRQALVKWTVLLAIFAFSFSLIGTFVVRSGVLTSVHSFAVDPTRGVFILCLIAAATGGALILYSLRMPLLLGASDFHLISREGSLALNNALVVTATATVFIGTFYPLLIDLIGRDKISVGAPYFSRTFGPIAILAAMALVAGPLLRWHKDKLGDVLPRIRAPFIAAILAAGVTLAIAGLNQALAAAGIGLAAWLIAGSVSLVGRRLRLGQLTLTSSLKLAVEAPRSFYSVALAHLGLGLLFLGIVGVTAWKQDRVLGMRPGQTAQFAGYEITLSEMLAVRGPNYEVERGIFVARRGGQELVLRPEHRFYPERETATTEAAIHAGPIANLYVTLGEQTKPGVWTVRLYHHPLIVWIWLGAAIMALGGALSWSDVLRAPSRQRQRERASAAA